MRDEINDLYCNDTEKDDEMDGACHIHGGEAKCIQCFGWETRKEEITGMMYV